MLVSCLSESLGELREERRGDFTNMDEDVSKVRSCSTINTFYHESQQEVLNLKTQLHTRDGIITDLKARLTRYERTCFVEGEEPCMVGPSKSLVGSLCRENCRLNQQLKDTQMDLSQKLESSKRVSNVCIFIK